MLWVMIGLFFTFLFLGVPIAFSMALTSLFGIIVFDIPIMMLVQQLQSGIDKFPFLAIPFFILAGTIMETGGISIRLVNLAKAMVGHIRGGLGMVVVVAEILFSGISGSSIADASAIGSIMIPSLKQAGYPEQQTVSIITAASGAGILIPPCLVMIVLATISNVSVAALFFGGFLPGILMCFSICIVIYFQARKGILPGRMGRFSLKGVLKTSVGAIVPMMMPVIIFGGILGGVATATEVAVLGVIYALIVSVFFYKEIKLSNLPKMLNDTVLITGSVMLMTGASVFLSWILATQHVPEMVGDFIMSFTSDRYVFLLITMFVFLITTALLDGLPALLIFFPIFYPIATKLGIHPLQFTLLAVAANGIGLILPPIGVLLIVTCGIARTSLSSMFRPMVPYIGILIISFLVIMFIPWIILVIPRMIWPTI
jgi:C4-dicarboxylate transporter DctM subunit